MDIRTEADGNELAQMARGFGIHAIPGSLFWDPLRPFCVSYPGQPDKLDLYHHGELNKDELKLVRCFDERISLIAYYAYTNTILYWQPWMNHFAKLHEQYVAGAPVLSLYCE